MGSKRGVGIFLALTGAGVLLYLYWYERHKLVKEYVDELRMYKIYLMRAYRDGKVDKFEQEFLNKMHSILKKKEEVIRGHGLLDLLIDELKKLGIVVTVAGAGFYITTKVIKQLIKRYRPPKYKCEICNRTFNSENRLKEHLINEHRATNDVNKYDATVRALEQTPDWFRDLVGMVLGRDINFVNNIIKAWNTLTIREKIMYGLMIAIAIIVVVIFARWFAFIPAIRNAFTVALACIR